MRRRLSDLYVRGKAIEVDDGEGDPVKVWLAKLNELDRETAARRANATKARFMIDADNEDSETFQAAYSEVREINERDELVAFLIADDVTKSRRRIEAERLSDEETWGKDDYLQGLFDAWFGDEGSPGLTKVQEEDPDDPEVKRVWDELQRYQNEVLEAVRHENERLLKDWADADIEMVRRKAAHRLIELRANDEFLREYQRQQIFFSVRDPAMRRQRYFQTVHEVDDLDDELRDYLLGQYDALMVDRAEGKDSPPEEDSSNLSDSADQPSDPEMAIA